jgi:hypothetical protein
MVSSTTRKIFSLAISLLVVVISLTGVALGATPPTGLSKLDRYTPGFSGAPGKMARDAAGNFYVTDFWGKRIVKLDRNGLNPSFIATNGRPSAVAVLPDNRLVVAIQVPQPYIAFYSQSTGTEISRFVSTPLYRPVAITIDAARNIYVLDSGDNTGTKSSCGGAFTNPGTAYTGKVRVYDPTGQIVLYSFGSRTATNCTSTENTVGGEFKQPSGIAFEKAGDLTLAPNGYIVIADTMNCRLQFFTAYSAGTGCTFVKSMGASNAELENTDIFGYGQTGALKLGDAVDTAFEYTSAVPPWVLNRIYVAERGRNEIVVVNPVDGSTLARLNGTTVTNASMRLPSAVLFEKTSAGGVLYTGNAPTSTPADILSIAIDSGAIPLASPPGTLTINTVPATVTVGPYTSLSGSVSSLSQVDCSVNGGTFVTMSYNMNWNNLSSSIPIVAGNNYILCKTTIGGVTTFAEARTYGGNLPVPPTVYISQPANNVLTSQKFVTVSGTSDTAGATVNIANPLKSFTGTATVDTNLNWSLKDVPLGEGSNVINVTATKGDSTTLVPQTVTVTADTLAPAIAVSSLADGSTTVKPVQNIDGIVTDANLGSATLNNNAITVNGVAVPASAKIALSATDTYFSVPVTLARGQNTVTVSATDLLGNTQSIPSRTVTFNPDLPGLTVTLPADNSYMSAAGAAANGTSDLSFTSVNACGTPVIPNLGTWTTPITILSAFDTCQFTATAGLTTVSEKRTLNATAGFVKLAITSPATDITTNIASVLIAGSAAANLIPIPTISVDGGAAVAVLSYNAVSGAFSHPVTLSSQGAHYFKVSANTATAAIRNIIYDTTPPAISIQANSYATPSQIVGSVEPSARITAIDAKLNGTAYSIPLSVLSYTLPSVPASGAVVWSANLSQPISYPYDEGSLTFTAVDPASNAKTITYAKGVPVGDINHDGKVDIDDALLCLRHICGTPTPLDSDWFQADVGLLVDGHAAQDGNVDISDAVLILGKAAGIVTF